MTSPQPLATVIAMYNANGIEKVASYFLSLSAEERIKGLVGFSNHLARINPKTCLGLLNQFGDETKKSTDLLLSLATVQDHLGLRAQAVKTLHALIAKPRIQTDSAIRAANLLVRLEDSPQALDLSKRAFKALGNPLRHAGDVLYIALKCADWPLAEQLTAQLRKAYAQGRYSQIFEGARTNLLWCDDPEINQTVVRYWNNGYMKKTKPLPQRTLSSKANAKIRIGYLSSDFREHPTSRLIKGLLRHHDASRFEVILYCSGWNDGSAIRKEIEGMVTAVHSVAQLSDANAAKLIHTHEIDILVELNGPTRATRMGILSFRPAPVQISYLGWPGSVGGGGVDYIVGDPVTIHDDEVHLYEESIIRVPSVYQVNDYSAMPALRPVARAAVGLPENGLVLGMFNAINKVRGEVWDVWMQILKSTENTLLWVLDPGQTARANILRYTQSKGVSVDRIVFAPPLKQRLHLERLQQIDLMLDPWPYGGHTSTADAIYAGVPVLAMTGNNFASRVSGALLRTAGLSELISETPEAYIAKAVDYLQSADKLSALKTKVQHSVRHSAVFDAVARTKEFEYAYTQIYALAANQQALRHIGMPELPKRPENKVPLTLVVGPWGAGTSAIAGMLAHLGLKAPGPYVKVRDDKTADTFEMLAFQSVLRLLSNEYTLHKVYSEHISLMKLKNFSDQLVAEVGEDSNAGLMLKHALSALFLDQLSQLFDLRVVGVVRSMDAIEKSRARRQWPATFGMQGAKIVYEHLFKFIVNGKAPFTLIRYDDVCAKPEAVAEHLINFCRLSPDDKQKDMAIRFVTR